MTLRDIQGMLDFGRLLPNDVIHRGTNPTEMFQAGRAYGLTLQLVPSLNQFSYQRLNSPLTVFVGPNNSGKSLWLREIASVTGPDAYVLSVNRFYQYYGLGYGSNDKDSEKHNQYTNLINQNNQLQNFEHQPFPPNLASLDDQSRQKMLTTCSKLLGVEIRIVRSNPKNELSQPFVEVDGQSVRFISTGLRLVITMLAALYDSRFSTILLDEPELGINPKIQSELARFIFDVDGRKSDLPHLKRIFVATHSHLFLDRQNLGNNFLVSKNRDEISLRQISSISQFHHVQFNLLGNDLESMFLPSAIIVVEGPSDYAVVKKAVELRFPKKRVTVIDAKSESEMDKTLRALADLLGDISVSPYRSRIFFLLDLVHSRGHRGTKEKLEKNGAAPDNIVVFSKNGIEYYYPDDILAETYLCGANVSEQLQIDGDAVSVGETSKTKVQLADAVAAKLTKDSVFGEELEGFFNRIQNET